jgi:hypothetical protein
MELKYEWLKSYKGFNIEEDEDILQIRRYNAVLETYSSKSRIVTEEFLRKRISILEQKVRGE